MPSPNVLAGFMFIAYDLRPDRHTFEDDAGVIDIQMKWSKILPENVKLVIYTVNANHFFTLDDYGNFIPKLDKLTM
jgi:hypothetical protein